MNRNKLFSIIFPSRSRLDLVEKLLISIEEKTKNKSLIEVISIVDQDDINTINLYHSMLNKISYDFYYICRKQKENLDLPNDYYDLGLKLRNNSYFTWIIGNDCDIITDNWEDLFYQAIKQVERDVLDDIDKNLLYYYIRMSDDTHWSNNSQRLNSIDASCCFPIMSSNYCDDLKEICPREIPSWGADTCFYQMIKQAKNVAVLDFTEILAINHNSVHNNKYKKDEIHERMAYTNEKSKINYNGVLYDKWPTMFEEMKNKRKKYLSF